ncbi:hypothetical protein HYH03_003370 [Edaphochlamys debaryana]|uniref:Uncharacterized protein n=1 Tax=Edaphochlamys debaryana TaxID=47281 RepID=A0A835YC94_9CHLO|nr:hypothetical protein HYH03_003370 [Edaphochlamys debaryana]|eukprot:KAG2498623.1 hypothetical protein HYH03_003370 [Edaphochlamys debaryana]
MALRTLPGPSATARAGRRHANLSSSLRPTPSVSVSASLAPRLPLLRRPRAPISATILASASSSPSVATPLSGKRLSAGPSLASGRRLAAAVTGSSRGRRTAVRASRTVGLTVEANLFSRVYRIVTAFFNGVVGSFEDPEKLLDRVAEEMTEDMLRMRQATAQVMASQKQLQAKQRNLQGTADQWLARAELAVSRGQDDLAREALKRRKVLQEDADRMNEQVVLQTQALEQLQANIRLLEGKLGEARSKKETLKARAASAKTSIALQEMIGGLQVRSGSSWAAFDKMEEKVAALEAQAQTASALATPDSLERQFAALEGDTGVEGELAALKKSRGGRTLPPPTTPEPPLAGRPLRDVFDPLERELEELRRRARE